MAAHQALALLLRRLTRVRLLRAQRVLAQRTLPALARRRRPPRRSSAMCPNDSVDIVLS